MKIFVAALLLAGIVATNGQGYSGQTFAASAEIRNQTAGDIANVTGYTRFRTVGNTLFFESALNNAVQITGVHLHLTPQRGVADGGPLVIALTNTTTNPLSATGSAPLVQIGNVTDTNLLANPQLAAARQGIIALGINDNTLQNIGDVDRLFRANVLYSDVHSVTRVSPNRVGSGLVFPLGGPSGAPSTGAAPPFGRKMI